MEVCAREGYLLESDMMRMVKEQCDLTVAKQGQIDLAAFEAIFNQILTAAQGRRTERDLMKLIVIVIEDSGLKIKSAWPFRWYRAVKRQAGMM